MSQLASQDDYYTSRVCKGSALLDDTKALLRAWDDGESADDLKQKALSNDLLGKATAQRLHDVVRRVFAARYLQNEAAPARWMKQLLDSNPPGNWFRDLCLLYSARWDIVLRDSAGALLQAAKRANRVRIDVDYVQAFLAEAEEAGKMRNTWSQSVRHRVAKGVCRVLTEFNLLSQPQGGVREILPFSPSRLAIAYLAHDLHFDGSSDSGVVDHIDWQIWQLSPEKVRNALDELSREGLWIFQSAGSVVRIAWNYENMEEAIDAIARLDLR